MVRTALAIGRGVDDTRSIRDMRASTKMKENHSSSNPRRKQKTFISSHHRLSQLINQLYRLCFCYLAYGLRYCLIMVHRILLWLPLVWMF